MKACTYASIIELVSCEVSCYLLSAIKPRVAQALSCDNMTDPVKTVAAVVLTVLAISAIGATHLTPVIQKKNATITVIFKLSSMSQT